MQDERYSTTRLLTCDKPACFDSRVDGITTLLKTPDGDQKVAEGGLRLQGFYKTGSEDKPLITVVTVVFNGAEFLEDTIRSVIEQTYDNVEYIIVDGGSKDGTLDIIRKYEHAIDYWVSKSDKGIYDAMNKAIDLGSGDWINFMNAGDSFFDSKVLDRVFNYPVNYVDAMVVYGDHEVRYPDRKKIVKAGKIDNLWKGSQFCHQSAFVLLNHHKNNKFNLNMKIAADFEFFYRTQRAGLNMNYTPGVLSKVSAGGVSDAKRFHSIYERFICLDNPVSKAPYYIFFMALESFKMVLKKYVKIKSR
jgi:glycosyltransferase involved in cell wall biosynthesis